MFIHSLLVSTNRHLAFLFPRPENVRHPPVHTISQGAKFQRQQTKTTKSLFVVLPIPTMNTRGIPNSGLIRLWLPNKDGRSRDTRMNGRICPGHHSLTQCLGMNGGRARLHLLFHAHHVLVCETFNPIEWNWFGFFISFISSF